MKHTYPVCLLALGGALLGGCSDKEDAPLVLTGTYESGSTLLATNPILMYTKNGQVNNLALVDNFLTRFRLTSYFSRTDTPIPSANRFYLTIDANGQARYFDTYPAQLRIDTARATVTSQSKQYFVLAANDSTGGFTSTGPSSSTNACSDMVGKMKVEYPGKRCYSTPSTTGFTQYCRIRPLRVVEIKGQDVSIPQLSWVVKRGQPATAGCLAAVRGEWNMFNWAATNQLADGDTIVVQMRNIALLKK